MYTKVGARKWLPVKKYAYIPEEIVLSVLENLPIESLLRFRCVSKQWSRWICEGESRKKLLIVSEDSWKSHSFRVIDQTVAQLEVIDVPPMCSDASCVSIHGSCNGLLLMEIEHNLYLWNPSIRWYSHISRYNRHDDYIDGIAGLCYDSNRDEYKAVLAWKNISPDYPVQDIKVFSVKHKSWKKFKEFPYSIGSGKPGPAMNDRLHWVVSTDDHFFAPQLIVYFDAKTEKFEKFPMPDAPKGKEGNPILGLGVLDGCLSMVLCEENAIYEGPVHVLSMKEYGVKESWTILFRIKDIKYFRELVPCFYTAEGSAGLVMMVNGGLRRCSFNVYQTNETSFIKDITPPVECGNAIVYEETLCRHDGGAYYEKKFLHHQPH